MFNINKEYIKENCSGFSFEKGMEYHFGKRVRSVQFNPKKNTFSAMVQDVKERSVRLAFDEEGQLTASRCSCIISDSHTYFCEHIVALLLLIEERDGTGFFGELLDREKAKRIFEIFSYREIEQRQEVLFEPTMLCVQNNDGQMQVQPRLFFRIGADRLYIVKDLETFLIHLEQGRMTTFSRKFVFSPSKHCFSGKDMKIVDFLLEMLELADFPEMKSGTGIYQDEDLMSEAGSYNRSSSPSFRPSHCFCEKFAFLTDRQFKRFLEIYAKTGRELPLEIGNHFRGKARIVRDDFKLNFNLVKEEMDLVLKVDVEDCPIPLTRKADVVFWRGDIYTIADHKAEMLKPMIEVLANYREKEFRFISDDRGRFVSEVLPTIDLIGTLEIDEDVTSLIDRRELLTEIYLDREEGAVTADVRFLYGERSINPFAPTKKECVQNDDSIVVRDVKKESAILDILAEADFKVRNNKVNLYADESIYNFVVEVLPKLQEHSQVFYTDAFKNSSVRRSIGFKVDMKFGSGGSGTELLDFDFDAEFIDRGELLAILETIRERRKYYKLKDGSLLDLMGKEINDIVGLLAFLDADEAEIMEGHVELPAFRALYLDYYLRNSTIRNVTRERILKNFVRNINEPVEGEFALPKGLRAELRDYQKIGFQWMKTLKTYSLGGILADDMGLGKTVQILTLLLSEKEDAAREALAGISEEEGYAPSLIIVPTSLVYNWCAEIEKFTPDLKVLAITGSKQERVKLIEQINGYDVIITSYPLIRRDYEEYKSIRFQYCILDEAQYIKNPNSQNALSVKCLNNRYRFALTGTPMENRLIELWSIFDYVIPGYLYTAKEFNERYVQSGWQAATVEIQPAEGQSETGKQPAAAEQSETGKQPAAAEQSESEKSTAAHPAAEPDENQHTGGVLAELSGQIRPFVLRRLKTDVLQELPEKIDTRVYAEMTDAQKKLYYAHLLKIKEELSQEISVRGFEKSHIAILAALTRLRQICCHPSLFIENYEDDSGKFLLLQELVRGALDGGHRILLFSQFTGMLALIRKWAEAEKIDYKYLDGQVKTKERHRLINDFNEGSGALFLISLKAGGTGINLTGADTVIHYDPWWNPAVEDQATDRAYRIGQLKTVQVIKLLTAGSIEEKIFAMQERKKQLIDTVIKPGETILTKLSQSDLEEILAWDES